MKLHNDIEEKLNKVSVTPLSEEEKRIMWRKIENGIAEPVKSPFWSVIASPFSSLRLQTSVATALIVAVLFGTTSITFAYADSAKPGDLLFPISALKEKIVISLTPTQNQNEVRLKYAEKRIEQGNEFLTALNTNVITSASTQTLGDKIATSSAPVVPTYHGKATSSPAVVGDAVSHLSATIAYLQGVKADMVLGGNISSAQTIQTAIDRILEQITLAANQNAVVVAKVQEHKNQFNVTVSTKNASTTMTTNLAINTKKDTQKVTITEKENTPAKKIEEKKADKEHDDQKDTQKENDDKDKNEENHGKDTKGEKSDKGFFGWLNLEKKTNLCHKGTNINIAGSAVKEHLAHGDIIGTCGSNTTSTTDTTAPVVSNISTSVTPTTAKITWGTNENAVAVFWYGTTTPLASSVVRGTSDTHQEVNLSSLDTNTIYSFFIVAKDASGNTSTTTASTFKTSVLPDATAPTFSDIVVAHASETATVSWKTNENATGKIYYGTITPLVPVSAQFTVSDGALVKDHVFNLASLATSTTYYFVLEGKDNTGDTGTSTEHQFTTGA